MKKDTFLRGRVAGLFVAAALLASCYAPLANQKGYLNLGLHLAKTITAPTDAIVMVVDSGYQDSLAEMLSLVSQGGNHIALSGSETDRLKTLGEQLTTSGIVKFGGFPFYRTTLNASSGSFQVPGIPAGRDYFVKVFVLTPGTSFSVQDFDKNFFTRIQSQNLVFLTEHYATPTGWQSWSPVAGQPVPVNADESSPITVTLGLAIP